MEDQSVTQDVVKEKVVAYYEATLPWYRLWYAPTDLALHYGFWDRSVRSRSEALLNENRFLAAAAHISKADTILDAGCGIGGSAIWLAKTYGCRVMGISTAPSHIAAARQNATGNGVAHLVSFELRDYTNTGFSDNTFNVAWAIESFCHATDKVKLFREIHRALKPGGRLIIADGFQRRKVANAEEQQTFDTFLRGLAVYETQWWEEYQTILEEIGFRNIKRWDKTAAITPSSRHLWWLGIIFYPVAIFLRLFGQGNLIAIGNWRAAFAQWKALKKGLWLYGVYYAEKKA